MAEKKGALMAPSIENVVRYLTDREFIKYGKVKTGKKLVPRRWYKPTCLRVVFYVKEFCHYPEHRKFSNTISSLDELAREALFAYKKFVDYGMYGPSWENLEYRDLNVKKNKEFARMFANSFIPNVQVFFKVPKPFKLPVLGTNRKPNESLAAFIDFLLRILHSEATIGSDVAEKYSGLQKELTYLLTYLGDTPFKYTRDLNSELKKLLAEFDMLANEAGSFIYSFVFALHPVIVEIFGARISGLLEKVELFNAKIKEYCIKFSMIPMRVTSSRSYVVDSFFIIDSLIEDLDNIIMGRQINFTPNDSLKDQVGTLYNELTLLRNFVKFIQNKDAGKLNESLTQIIYLAYEAEYLITCHVAGNICSWYLNLRLPTIVVKIELARIGLSQNMEIVYNREILKCSGAEESSSRTSPSPDAAVDVNHTVELDGHISERISVDLIGKSKTPRQTILIYGMPGLGKTTMASKLYNSHSVCKHFDRRAWCNVSQTYSLRELLIQILMSVARETDKDKILRKGDGELGVDIHKTLKQRRYLIVLDDVWDSNVWYAFERYFPNDGNGSRVMLTSRNKDVAPNGSIFYTLPLLSQHQCWHLLEKKVFPEESCPPGGLLRIGKKIVAKCFGLPLAVVITAGILVNLEREESAWEIVEKKLNDVLSDDQSSCRRILELSYEQLPHYLKPCFLYFAAFREDAEIPVKKLLQLWIAEGFIPKKEEKSPEEIAQTYLLDLINRSLVLPAKRGYDGGIKTCRVHDLLHDICIRKANEDNFMKSIDDDISIDDKRVCSWNHSKSWVHSSLHCRSFLGANDKPFFISNVAVARVIDKWDSYYVQTRCDLPLNLRYLVVHEPVRDSALEKLVNLEFLCIILKYKYDGSHFYIPQEVLNLVKLKHLIIRPEAWFYKSHSGLETTNLRSLSYVNIDDKADVAILRRLSHLQELKCICPRDGTIFPDLSFFTELESLKMVYIIGFRSCFRGKAVRNLKFPSTIKKLCLEETKLPWKKISIVGRLPHLSFLKLLHKAFVGKKWGTNYDEFQELRFLEVDSLDLRRWRSCCEHFPRLEHLVFDSCFNLKEIPSALGYIATLHTIKIRHCLDEAGLSAVQIEEEQRRNGNEELEVIIEPYYGNKLKEELQNLLKISTET